MRSRYALNMTLFNSINLDICLKFGQYPGIQVGGLLA